jgi:hypothetical protein
MAGDPRQAVLHEQLGSKRLHLNDGYFFLVNALQRRNAARAVGQFMGRRLSALAQIIKAACYTSGASRHLNKTARWVKGEIA